MMPEIYRTDLPNIMHEIIEDEAVIVNIDNRHSFPIEMYWSDEYPTLFFVNSQNEVFIHKPLKNISQKDIQDILIEIMHNKLYNSTQPLCKKE